MALQFSKTFIAVTGLSTALCMTALPSIASATTNSDAWIPATTNLTHVGNAFTEGREKLVEDLGGGEVLFTSDSDSNGLLFLCTDSRLRAFITTRPQSWQDLLKESSRRGRSRTVLLSLDGEKASNIGTFIYKPALKILVSRDAIQSIKLYNAVVNGQNINIDVGSKGHFDITPPKPNIAFADFGSQCGIGRHK